VPCAPKRLDFEFPRVNPVISWSSLVIRITSEIVVLKFHLA